MALLVAKPRLAAKPNGDCISHFDQSCIKFKKFNSSSVHGVELGGQFKFSSLGKN